MKVQRSDGEDSAVIDDDMIALFFQEEDTRASEETAATSGAGMAKGGNMILADRIGEAPELRLSFKHIVKIDNLQGECCVAAKHVVCGRGSWCIIIPSRSRLPCSYKALP